MKMAEYILIFYFAVINFLSVIFCVLDKRNSKKGRRRIAEKKLLGLSIFGGAVGMYIAMLTIRHKTRHYKFMVGLPLIIVLQIIVAYFLLTKL